MEQRFDENGTLINYTYAMGASIATRKQSSAGRLDWYNDKTGKIAGDLENVSRGLSPFDSQAVRGAIDLCQKAYWNVAVFRSTIDIQTEFANSRIVFKSKNKRVEKFFQEWYKEVNGWYLGERFFREWFRSGNVFIYKFRWELDNKKYRQFIRAGKKMEIPMRFAILNPLDMRCASTSSFIDPIYVKILNRYEIAALKNPQTDNDKEFYKSLPKEAKEQIKKGLEVQLPLNSTDLNDCICSMTLMDSTPPETSYFFTKSVCFVSPLIISLQFSPILVTTVWIS